MFKCDFHSPAFCGIYSKYLLTVRWRWVCSCQHNFHLKKIHYFINIFHNIMPDGVKTDVKPSQSFNRIWPENDINFKFVTTIFIDKVFFLIQIYFNVLKWYVVENERHANSSYFSREIQNSIYLCIHSYIIHIKNIPLALEFIESQYFLNNFSVSSKENVSSHNFCYFNYVHKIWFCTIFIFRW